MEKELEKNLYMIFRIPLALEDYQDHTENNNNLVNEAFTETNNFNEIKETLTDEEKLESSNDLLKKLNNVLDIIGREKFIFYDDGDINYKWDTKGEKNE